MYSLVWTQMVICRIICWYVYTQGQYTQIFLCSISWESLAALTLWSSVQIVLSHAILHQTVPELRGKTADSRTGVGSIQEEPGAACSAREPGNAPTHTQCVPPKPKPALGGGGGCAVGVAKGRQESSEGASSGRSWNNLGNKTNKEVCWILIQRTK